MMIFLDGKKKAFELILSLSLLSIICESLAVLALVIASEVAGAAVCPFDAKYTSCIIA